MIGKEVKFVARHSGGVWAVKPFCGERSKQTVITTCFLEAGACGNTCTD